MPPRCSAFKDFTLVFENPVIYKTIFDHDEKQCPPEED